MSEPTRILIVEDERLIAKGIERCLERLGHSVAGSVASGEQAISHARQQSPDLILLDINLGKGMDGVETARQLREFLDIPIIFLTAHSDGATLERAKQTQPSGFVLKPYDDNDLRSAIEIGLFRYRAQLEVQLSQRWLGATLASIGDGVIATDLDLRVSFINTVAENITGWAQVEALGRPIEEVLPLLREDTLGAADDPVARCLQSGRIEYLAAGSCTRARDGKLVPIEDSASPIRDQHGQISGAIMAFRDVSERRRLEEQLAQERENLRQANQQLTMVNAHKDFVLGMVAHDLRNPLSVIQAYAHFVQTSLVESADPKVLRFVDNIQISAQTMLALVENLLDVTALESGKLTLLLEPTELVAVVQKVVDSNLALFDRKQIEVLLEIQPGLEPLLVIADGPKLEQVVTNLLTNALKYSPRESRVIVSLEQGEGQVRVSVRDHGPGIAAEDLTNLFQAFETTSNRPTAGERSTGLGLAIAHKIVQGHGGRIEVDSSMGEGSIFRVVLPLGQPDPDQGMRS